MGPLSFTVNVAGLAPGPVTLNSAPATGTTAWFLRDHEELHGNRLPDIHHRLGSGRHGGVRRHGLGFWCQRPIGIERRRPPEPSGSPAATQSVRAGCSKSKMLSPFGTMTL